jgi:hypothetical protein
MIIQHASETDLLKLRELYDIAKRTMNRIGNQNQWKPGEPYSTELLEYIKKEELYLVLEGQELVGAFVFFLGGEPSYDIIEAGTWPNDLPYGTIHRIASNGKVKGILQEIFSWTEAQTRNLRIDTHRENAIMNYLLPKYGFHRCGIIHLKNGEERIAYAKTPQVD